MKDTQLKIVRTQLEEHGEITRNWCLERYITRLGARINDLKNAGWVIEGFWLKYAGGRDYVYRVISMPKKIEHKIITMSDGTRRARQMTL